MTGWAWLALAVAAVVAMASLALVVASTRRRSDAARPVEPEHGGAVERRAVPTAEHPARRARQVRAQSRSAREALRAAAARNDEVVVAAASAMADHVAAQVVTELVGTPIGALRSLTSVSGVRLSGIGSAGYSNVAQVLAAGSARLQQVPGIGPASATQLLTAAAEVRESAFRRANYGLRSSTPSPEQAVLLTRIWALAAVRRNLEVPPRQLVDQERHLRRLGRSLWLPSVRPLWFVVWRGPRRRWVTRVGVAGREVDEVLRGDLLAQARVVVAAGLDPPDAEALWRWVADDAAGATAGLEVAVQAMLGAASASSLLATPRRTIPVRSVGDVIARRMARVPRPRPGYHGAPAPGSGVDDTTALYRLYDGAGRLLYVGISNDVHSRIRTHRMDKHWGPAVADVRIEWFATRAQALAAEASAIRRERPRHNVMHNR